MMTVKAIIVLLINFILYASFGSFFCIRKKGSWSLPVTVAVGFFAYYALFAIVCLPVMFTYRPLSLLSSIWMIPCIILPVASAALFGRQWVQKAKDVMADIRTHKALFVTVIVITLAVTTLAVITYSFTLDAAYYVATVTTNVDTNMINVYDPFTGNWQDHFELRYVFATYYANDSVVCQLTHIPALIETKGVMSSVVMLIVNMIYAKICRFLFDDDRRALLMYILMTAVNFLFISIYTTSNFLMTRTYEGKSIVGNISVLLIFLFYMMILRDESEKGMFLKLFIVCLGTATVSSTANMVIPAEVFLLFLPLAVMKKKPGYIIKAALCIVPEIIMMLIYVLYVKGYFAIYTFPR